MSGPMEMVDAGTVAARLGWARLIDGLAEVLAGDRVEAPERQVHRIALGDGREASVLIMPAWDPGRAIGVKVVTFFPGNDRHGLPSIHAGYLVFDGADGRPRAVLDGDALTARRTAAASALAARHLARPEAAELLVVGTGQLAQPVAEAHGAVRAYRRVRVWGRQAGKAAALAERLAATGLPAEPAADLEAAVQRADVITSVTASTAPLIRGDWLKPGSHLDLIGSFRPDMRETDAEAIAGAELFVDGRAGALMAGDLAQAIAEGAITPAHIRADLGEVLRGAHPGRSGPMARTVFKSAGLAAEDLAAALLVLDGTG